MVLQESLVSIMLLTISSLVISKMKNMLAKVLGFIINQSNSYIVAITIKVQILLWNLLISKTLVHIVASLMLNATLMRFSDSLIHVSHVQIILHLI